METEANNSLSSDTSTVSSQEPINSTPKSRKKLFMIGIGFLGVILIVGVVGAIFGTKKNQSQNISPEKNTNNVPSSQKSFANLVSGAIVYGFWSGDSSVINVLDIATNKNEPLAVLPINIKHIKIISPEKFFYIKNTDVYDRGTQIVMYDINSKKETVILFADDTFGIDDYVLSSDGKYLSAWEAKNGTDTRLLGGRSRVYSVNTATQEKHLLYDETPTPSTPVHYPIAVKSSGEVFTDRFLPNSGAGWGYGMSMIDFAGLDSTDIPSMVNGTYSTQPVVSPDGKKLVFVGYNGKKGPGEEVVNGFRRAILFPNTIETFDLSSLSRNTIQEAQGSGIYSSAVWSPNNGNILYVLVGDTNTSSGTYVYNVTTHIASRILKPADSSTSSVLAVVQAQFPGLVALVSEELTSSSVASNLGSFYSGLSSSMYLLGQSASDKKELALDGHFTQPIDIMPQSFFMAVKSARVADVAKQRENLQLETFSIKANLAPEREGQQSDPQPDLEDTPACHARAAAICNPKCGTNFVNDLALLSLGYRAPMGAVCFVQCFQSFRRIWGCMDSPLYLYGEKDTKVQVQVGTAIESPNATYTSEKGFNISLLGDGNFQANGKTVSSLSFDYTSPVKKLVRPNYGSIVEKSKIEQTIKEYALKFGLNARETRDVVSYAKANLKSSYTLISFYDDAMSKKVLPLYFDPMPDHYRNIVFYFERFDHEPEFSVAPPIFEKVDHSGFSAVEISYILK